MSFSTGRRWRLGLQVVLSAVALLAIVAMVNFLAARHPRRLHWTGDPRFDLSSQTHELLRSLTNDVTVIIFFDTQEPLYSSVSGLLKEYQLTSARIRLRTVDYTRSPDEVLLVKTTYKLPASEERDMVIFDANGKQRFVFRSELSELKIGRPLPDGNVEVRRTAFRGEQLFTSAILTTIEPRTPRAYAVQDHGEHRIDDHADRGYSKLGAVLKTQNIELAPLLLRGTNEIPADCQLILIGRPLVAYGAEELGKLDRFLQRGGRMMVLFNYQTVQTRTGLEELLEKWGVSVGANAISDPDNASGRGQLAVGLGTHTVVRPMVADRLTVQVALPRTVQPATAAGADGLQVEWLFTSGPKARLLRDFQRGLPSHSPRDPVGAFAFAVAAEKGNIQGLSAGRGMARLVVVGDSELFSNQMLDAQANATFARLAVNWLLDRAALYAGIAPQPVQEYTLSLTRAQMRHVRWILLAAAPGGVFLLGLGVWLRRRR